MTDVESSSLILNADEFLEIMNKIMTNVEYFNNAGVPNTENEAFYPWDTNLWNKNKSFLAGGNLGRQRLTEYPSRRPFLIHGENSQNNRVDWYHKRNFTLFLVNNAPGAQSDFPGNAFSSGENGVGSKKPIATTVVTDAAWIMCAVSLRGQARYKFASNQRSNGYCWDGTSRTMTAVGYFQRLEYFACKIDFIGATFVNKKRSEPIGFFHDEPVYSVERVEDGHTFEVEVPGLELPLPDIKSSFPLS
jgi:hypothetical protein